MLSLHKAFEFGQYLQSQMMSWLKLLRGNYTLNFDSAYSLIWLRKLGMIEDKAILIVLIFSIDFRCSKYLLSRILG